MLNHETWHILQQLPSNFIFLPNRKNETSICSFSRKFIKQNRPVNSFLSFLFRSVCAMLWKLLSFFICCILLNFHFTTRPSTRWDFEIKFSAIAIFLEDFPPEDFLRRNKLKSRLKCFAIWKRVRGKMCRLFHKYDLENARKIVALGLFSLSEKLQVLITMITCCSNLKHRLRGVGEEYLTSAIKLENSSIG